MTAWELVEGLLAEPVIAEWSARIEEVVGPAVQAHLDATPPHSGAKAVKDSIWGMIDLEAREATVVDLPIVQRLRRIRQLGVSYLTYPTASYSRFEHALGAMHQSERMLRAVSRRSHPSLQPTIDGAVPVTRLAALTHDIGHLPLSHLTERYYTEAECESDKLIEVSALRKAVSQYLRKKRPALAECLSALLLTAPTIRHALVDRAGYSNTDVATAALSILGRPATAQQAFVMQLITNAIDADKLDYMFRDSFVTGVPIGIDLNRLLYKLFCVEVVGKHLPGTLKSMFSPEDKVILLATDLSGYQLAYDLTAARTILFERIYFHHKTRAAERVALSILKNRDPHPVDLLGQHDGWFSAEAGEGDQEGIQRLLGRRLPKRVFAFSREYLMSQALPLAGERIRPTPETDAGWNRLYESLSVAAERAELAKEMVETTSTLSELLVRHNIAIEHLWLEPPPLDYDVDSPQLLVRRPDGTTRVETGFAARASSHTINPSDTIFAFTTATDVTDTLLQHIGIELTLSDKYGLYFGRDSADIAKLDIGAIGVIKRSLEAAAPAVFARDGRLRPASEFVRQADSAERVQAVRQQLQSYHGGLNAVNIDDEHLLRFIDQFPERLAPAALQMLESIDYVGPESLANPMVAFLRASTPENAVFAGLTTDPGKSANLLSYYVREAFAELRPVSLAAALREHDGPICLYDDFLLSGTQGLTAIQLTLGEQPILDEPLAEELPQELKEDFRRREILFRFAVVHPKGLQFLAEQLGQLGVNADIRGMRQVPADATPLEKAVGDDYRNLRDFLREVGYSLLRSTKGESKPAKWTEDLCSARSLGYGGDELLLAAFYNVPTGTITALWKTGTFRNIPWIPLLPRRA